VQLRFLRFHHIRCSAPCRFALYRVVPAALAAILGIVLGACGGGPAAPGAGTAFCGNAASVDALLANRSSPEIAFLKTHETSIDDLRNHAPAAVKADVITVVTSVDSAVAADKPALANTATMNHAWAAVKTYCGIGQ
jgi:hypothetical protein